MILICLSLLCIQIVYSEDEEVACTDFTNDFYKLVNIRSNSSRSLFSYQEGQTDDEDDEDDEEEDDDDEQDSSMSESQVKARISPTPSEAGRAQLTSCSSSETDEHSMTHPIKEQQIVTEQAVVEEQEEVEEEEEHDYAVIEECREMAARANQSVINEQQCIAQIIKTELRRPPHVLVKSKSVLEDQEPSCILRHNQRRELESSVVRSDSISCALMAKMAKETSISSAQQTPPAPAVVSKLKERLLQRHAVTPSTPTATANSWRRSNGWKRVTSPVQAAALVSPTKKVGKLRKISGKNSLKQNSSHCSRKQSHRSCQRAATRRRPHEFRHAYTHPPRRRPHPARHRPRHRRRKRRCSSSRSF